MRNTKQKQLEEKMQAWLEIMGWKTWDEAFDELMEVKNDEH